jgi:hypothetical protein
MVNKHMKRWSISLVIRVIQIKTTMRYHFIPIRNATIKKITSVGEDVEKVELLWIGGNIKLYITVENSMAAPQKIAIQFSNSTSIYIS